MDNEAKKILSRLQNQCARREYCSSEVLRKAATALATSGDASAEEILAALVAEGYVDDLRYATAFARDKSTLGGWGPVKIRYALRAKKIDDATIDAALREIEPDKALDKLERLIAAKRRTLEGDPQINLKLIRFALSRGYEYEDVRRVLDALRTRE